MSFQGVSSWFVCFLLGIAIVFSACRKENTFDCFKTNGSEVTETRNPGEFLDIFIYDKMELHVRQGPVYKIEITGGENLMNKIVTEVKEGRLIIDNRNTCNFVRGYKRGIKVVVTMPYLRYLENDGVASAYVEDFIQDTLVVRAESSGDVHVGGRFNEVRTSSHGNGDMYVSGHCNSFYIYAYGTNYVHAQDLHTDSYLFVHSLTLGDCTVNADGVQLLACNIENDGNVYYLGKPKEIVDYSKNEKQGRLYEK